MQEGSAEVKDRVSFIGRNNGFAIALKNHINLMRIFFISLFVTFIIVLLIVCFDYTPNIFLLFIFPSFFLLLSFVVFLFAGYDSRVFLTKQKQEHIFILAEDEIIKDKKLIKLKDKIKFYKYRNFIFMETSHSYFIIKDNEYKNGGRSELLNWAKTNGIRIRFGY